MIIILLDVVIVIVAVVVVIEENETNDDVASDSKKEGKTITKERGTMKRSFSSSLFLSFARSVVY